MLKWQVPRITKDRTAKKKTACMCIYTYIYTHTYTLPSRSAGQIYLTQSDSGPYRKKCSWILSYPFIAIQKKDQKQPPKPKTKKPNQNAPKTKTPKQNTSNKSLELVRREEDHKNKQRFVRKITLRSRYKLCCDTCISYVTIEDLFFFIC